MCNTVSCEVTDLSTENTHLQYWTDKDQHFPNVAKKQSRCRETTKVGKMKALPSRPKHIPAWCCLPGESLAPESGEPLYLHPTLFAGTRKCWRSVLSTIAFAFV